MHKPPVNAFSFYGPLKDVKMNFFEISLSVFPLVFISKLDKDTYAQKDMLKRKLVSIVLIIYAINYSLSRPFLWETLKFKVNF